MIDLRLLHYFATAAELEHIGKAAERLHISQSPLSRQIRQLEEDLNLELFVRERQRIRLTESGRWLLGEARKLLAHAEKIQIEAIQRALGQTGTLSISFVSSAMWSGNLPSQLRSFQERFPAATLELRNLRSAPQVEAIESGRVDLGFVSSPSSSETIETFCVAEEPICLIAPAAHALATQGEITPMDLEAACWILIARSLAPKMHERFLAVCGQLGFAPRIVQEVAEPNTLLALVESGFGVSLLEGSARNWAPRTVCFRPAPWFPFQSRTFMIRPAQGRQPLADLFAEAFPRLTVPGFERERR